MYLLNLPPFLLFVLLPQLLGQLRKIHGVLLYLRRDGKKRGKRIARLESDIRAHILGRERGGKKNPSVLPIIAQSSRPNSAAFPLSAFLHIEDEKPNACD